MKHLFLILFSLFIYSEASALSVGEAFDNFYDDEKINSNRCGQNIYYFLNYLDEHKVEVKNGFVVSIHDDYPELNSFDSRWGSLEYYENGDKYYRSNWYFHVFVVIDDVVYDFSQAGKKKQSLGNYLRDVYLPRQKTRNIPMQGHLDSEKAFKTQINREMKIYKIDDYRKKYGPSLYEGSFVELFKFSNGEELKLSVIENIKHQTNHQGIKIDDRTGVAEIKNPTFITKDGQIPLRAESVKICRAFGYMGAMSSGLEYQVSDKVKMLEIYSFLSFVDDSQKRLETTISFRDAQTVGAIPSQPLVHYATKVRCADLKAALEKI